MSDPAPTNPASSDPGSTVSAATRVWPLSVWARRGALVGLAVLVADQLSKALVLGPLNFSPEGCREAALALAGGGLDRAAAIAAIEAQHSLCRKIELSGVFDLTMVWNPGVSFGLLSAGSAVQVFGLVVFSLGLAGFMSWWLARTTRPLTALGLGLIIGGALGNVVDRALYGAVVDFLDFSGPWFRVGGFPVGFPYVFNVADAAINVGVASLVADWALEERARRAAGAAPAP